MDLTCVINIYLGALKIAALNNIQKGRYCTLTIIIRFLYPWLLSVDPCCLPVVLAFRHFLDAEPAPVGVLSLQRRPASAYLPLESWNDISKH